jgi:phosphate transport system substrate-binding protein
MGSFQAAAANASWDREQGYYIWLVNTIGEESWPITAATFILLRKDRAARNADVARFFDWSFRNGDRQAERLIYVPLPEALKEDIREYWKANGINL